MEGEIVNKVANSALKVFDLEELYPTNPRMDIDIAQWLYEGFVLREKEFRASLKEVDWSIYENAYVGLFCSTDAILPGWAYMLLTSHLQPVAKRIFLGDRAHLEKSIYQELLFSLNYSQYADLPVIIKGCSKKEIPEEAYVLATQLMMNHARSVMFGEACSAVPVYKRTIKK
ncbi:DUF2480 family protein [Myroides odoratimimus]|uniref:DUF2480 family protein n=1 Tax=Myroides odoratimimus TaxID=76832 RepID=A0AAI8C404_9FLAO|nr:DUF2480 family protein [Myroides odoratimimus]ALU25662.1 hypothetical protein AS202_05725 [Myroides odoratimimus]MCO7721832.1 DUF2480 family protein [Myroides odoratimimus]MDM1033406.1 DUF2480 family protein [Myroides odoratimimus]MDM1036650.1 DUF2480 family protein [Myroides odoratimimus]MDM1050713.1 DUF2480 family protein [Myroides odoratimimus]